MQKKYHLLIIISLLSLACPCMAAKVPINSVLCGSVDTIVRGSIVSMQKMPLERVPSAGIIARVGKKNVLQVEKVYKGSVTGKYIDILTQGGKLSDDIEISVADQPVFVNHEKVILFLNKRTQPPIMYQVFGNTSGMFIIHNEQELLDIEQVLYKYL